jgi:hypothetical protein
VAEQDHCANLVDRLCASAAVARLLPEVMLPMTKGWSRHLTLLDVPTVIITDDPALLTTACAAYADWIAVEPLAAEPGIELRLERGSSPTKRVSASIRVEGSRLILSGDGIDGEADAVTGRARCTVPDWLADDAEALSAEIVDTLLLFLLARTGRRTPVHASGVMWGATALVLAGPSGSGKSTLALAAAERGLHILSDDTLYVQLEPGFRIWGFPRPIHVFAKDAPPGQHAVRLRGGKEKSVIDLHRQGNGEWSATRAKLVVLRRGDRLSLDAITRDEAIASLSRLDAGFDLLSEASAVAARALADAQPVALTLETNPRRAIDFLVEQLGAAGQVL